MTTKSRFWADLSTQDFARLQASGEAAQTIAVLPVAATEQHGPHLPLSVDTVLADGVITAALALLAPGLPVLFLPTQAVGFSPEHARFPGTLTLKNDYFATAAARLGYAFDRFLVYGKVGGAWSRDKWSGNDGLGGSLSATSNRSGWMLGAGVEYAFLGNWSAKLEYDYLMFPSVTPTFATAGGLTVVGTSSIKANTQILKAGLNYRFTAF